MSSRIVPVLTGLLLVILGGLRGFGGVVLLSPFRRHVATAAGSAQLILLGLGLLVVAGLCVWAGMALMKGKRSGVTIGLVALVAFVAGGVLNGTVLYGSPRMVGLGGNLLVALLMAALLLTIRARLPRP